MLNLYLIVSNHESCTGNILIAINPFQKLPHLYDAHMMQQYKWAHFGVLIPHLFVIVDTSYRLLSIYVKESNIILFINWDARVLTISLHL